MLRDRSGVLAPHTLIRQTALEAESALREKIRDAVRDFEAAVRSTTSILTAVHATPEADCVSLITEAQLSTQSPLSPDERARLCRRSRLRSSRSLA